MTFHAFPKHLQNIIEVHPLAIHEDLNIFDFHKNNHMISRNEVVSMKRSIFVYFKLYDSDSMLGDLQSCHYLHGTCVAPLYSTQLGGQIEFADANQFYHIYIFDYCINKCRIIISVKEGPSFCQLTLSFNMTCIPFQHYHLQNIIRVHLHK